MTLSVRNFQLAAAIMLFAGTVRAASPPDAEMAAAGAAIAAAERVPVRGAATDSLVQARASFVQAQDAMARRKYREALRLSEEARAAADLALARARLVNAQVEVEGKQTRNAELRRQLLVLPETGR